MLYYVRKDVDKANIERLYPSRYGPLFNGKPIETRIGKGYIIGAKVPE